MPVTDRRTDRILITIPCLHYMQRGKNVALVMYCNLKLPDIMPVILRLNYETDFNAVSQCVAVKLINLKV